MGPQDIPESRAGWSLPEPLPEILPGICQRFLSDIFVDFIFFWHLIFKNYVTITSKWGWVGVWDGCEKNF